MRRRVDRAKAPAETPIQDHAFVGDCHGSALVSLDGSVDWCVLDRFDGEPLFCGILDPDRGGSFAIRPTGSFESARSYIGATQTLRTVFTTATGVLQVTDCMPVARHPDAGVHDYVNLRAPGWLVRRVEVLRGVVSVQISLTPTVGYGTRFAQLDRTPRGFDLEGGGWLAGDVAFAPENGATARLELKSGQRRTLVLGRPGTRPPADLAVVDRWLAWTSAFWKEWCDYLRYEGPHRSAVERSALVLKALTYAPTGAIVAAPTTSLPEWPGGVRNWDYRYCWLRDATFALHGLAMVGYSGEARRFAKFLREVPRLAAPRHLQIMYGVTGETRLEERTLDHLAGHAGSRPVRIGNAAHLQDQLDVHGEVVEGLAIQHALGISMEKSEHALVMQLARTVAHRWEDPDQGFWESRGPAHHHVLGKVMSWVALDRALRLCGADPELERERARIVSAVHAQGVHDGHLTRAFDDPGPDATLLVIPTTGFPLPEGVAARTIEYIERELRDGDFVRRYPAGASLHGPEGAFLMCSFWLVDALLLTGRAADASQLFDRLVNLSNDVGLLAEEVDPASGAFLGNFPQAFSHLALLRSAKLLELMRSGGADALAGDDSDRALRAAGATSGTWALWYAMRQTGRVGRFRSSVRSRIALALLPPPR